LALDPYSGPIEAMIAERPADPTLSLVRLEGNIVSLTNERGWYIAQCDRRVQRGHSGVPVFAPDRRIVGIITEVDEGSNDVHILPSTTIAAAVEQYRFSTKRRKGQEESQELGHNFPRVERGSLVRAHLELEPIYSAPQEKTLNEVARYRVYARLNFTGRMRLDLRCGWIIVGVTRATLVVRDERGGLDTATVAFAIAPGEHVDTWVRATGSEDPGRVEAWTIVAPPSASNAVLEGDIFTAASSSDPRTALVEAVSTAKLSPVVSGEITIGPNVIKFEAAPGSHLPSLVLNSEKKRLQLARRVLEKSAQSRIDLPVRLRT
jgi:hypothetical protein